MRLTLPFPPSANTYWRHNRGRTHVSDEAREYRTGVKLRALTAGLRDPLKGPVCVSVAIYRPAKRGDLDNSLKVLLDSLRGVAFIDDAQVEELHAMRFEDKANPRAVVTVETLATTPRLGSIDLFSAGIADNQNSRQSAHKSCPSSAVFAHHSHWAASLFFLATREIKLKPKRK